MITGGAIIISNKEKEILVILGNNIQNIRKKSNISQNKLAKACNINRSYLSEIENGTRNTTILTLYRISIALNTSLNKLLN